MGITINYKEMGKYEARAFVDNNIASVNMIKEAIRLNTNVAEYVLNKYPRQICDNVIGTTYAHLIFRMHVGIACKHMHDPDIVQITDKNGWSVIQEGVIAHFDFVRAILSDKDNSFLFYSTLDGNSVARIILKKYASRLETQEIDRCKKILMIAKEDPTRYNIVGNNGLTNKVNSSDASITHAVANVKEPEMITPQIKKMVNEPLLVEIDPVFSEIKKHALGYIKNKKIIELGLWLKDDDFSCKKIVENADLAALSINYKDTLGHVAVRFSLNAALYVLDHLDVGSIKNTDGWSIAHEAVVRHPETALNAVNNYDISILHDELGVSIAHKAVDVSLEAAMHIFKSATAEKNLLGIEDDNYITVAQIAIAKHGEVARMILKDKLLRAYIIVSPKRPQNWTYAHEAVSTHLSCAKRVVENMQEEMTDIVDSSGKNVYQLACEVIDANKNRIRR